MSKVKCIAEIGICHQGSLETAKRLIELANIAGFDYVKFQKRTPDLCVPEAQKNVMKETPWGEMTYLEYKKRMEFEKEEYDVIKLYCEHLGIKFFASVWDKPSVDFMVQYTDIGKIPSALIHDKELVEYARQQFKTLIISTGMSSEEEVVEAVENSNADVLMHTNSSYPAPPNELNLRYITYLKDKYPDKSIGYSSHTFGLTPTYTAVALGSEWVEVHVTLDHTGWDSDSSSALEPVGMLKMCKAIREIESSFGEYGPRKLLKSELKKRKTLRGS